ncbi:hypothetical protein ACFUEN_35720 [Streptomyces griseorubiginosus]
MSSSSTTPSITNDASSTTAPIPMGTKLAAETTALADGNDSP